MPHHSFDDLIDSGTDAKAVFSGVRWTGLSQIITESVRMLVSIYLARLLSPEDFGLLSMAGVVTGFFMVLQYLGAPGVIIQRKQLTNRLASSLFMLNLAFSLILFSGLLLAAPFLSGIYGKPQLTPIIQALGLRRSCRQSARSRPRFSIGKCVSICWPGLLF